MSLYSKNANAMIDQCAKQAGLLANVRFTLNWNQDKIPEDIFDQLCRDIGLDPAAVRKSEVA